MTPDQTPSKMVYRLWPMGVGVMERLTFWEIEIKSIVISCVQSTGCCVFSNQVNETITPPLKQRTKPKDTMTMAMARLYTSRIKSLLGRLGQAIDGQVSSGMVYPGSLLSPGAFPQPSSVAVPAAPLACNH